MDHGLGGSYGSARIRSVLISLIRPIRGQFASTWRPFFSLTSSQERQVRAIRSFGLQRTIRLFGRI